MPMRRRDLFRFGGGGGGIGLIGAAAWSAARVLGVKAVPPAPLPDLGIDCAPEAEASTGVGYSAKFSPPAYAVDDRGALHAPPPLAPLAAEVREFDLSVVETTLEGAAGQNVKVWA